MTQTAAATSCQWLHALAAYRSTQYAADHNDYPGDRDKPRSQQGGFVQRGSAVEARKQIIACQQHYDADVQQADPARCCAGVLNEERGEIPPAAQEES